MHIDLLLII